MSRTKIIFAVFVVLILGILAHRVLDNDPSLLPPLSQKITNPMQEVAPINPVDHIVVLVMENKSSSSIVSDKHAPYLNALLHSYSFADNYYAVAHPSLPNYIALLSGSTFGINNDCIDCYIAASNLTDQLEQVNKTWKAYMESIPTTCFKGNSYPYAQRHNPFIYFDDIRKNPTRCKNIVPFTELQKDLSSKDTTPDFLWITPNVCHDMHDCSVEKGDKWLSDQIPLILASPAFTVQKSLLVITWDEGEGEGSESNHIPTIFIGNTVKKGFVTRKYYTHYSLLHTVEKNWNLPALTRNVENSKTIDDIFVK